MAITVCTGKLHRVKVTEARLDYRGSITIDSALMEAVGILPFQLVHINNMANAAHWETYVIPAPAASGTICLNGCPARLFHPGDEVIVLSLDQVTRQEAVKIEQRVAYVDDNNKLKNVETLTAASFTAEKHP